MLNDERFIKLVEQIEDIGGELLPETHWPESVTYTLTGPHGREKRVEVELTGCGHETLVQIPYDLVDIDKDGIEHGEPSPGNYKACAICDLVALQPRFL